jgi:hypothetical protein
MAGKTETRPYVVLNKKTGHKQLVKDCASQAQAIRKVVGDQYEAQAASAQDVIELLTPKAAS